LAAEEAKPRAPTQGPPAPKPPASPGFDIQVDDPGNTSPPEQTYTPGCAGSDNCSIQDTYTFRPASFPPDGEHTVTVIARDRLGQTSTRTLRVVTDTQPPSIAEDEPNPPSAWNRNRPVGVSASDAGAGVRSVVATIGGQEIGRDEAEDCAPGARCETSLPASFDSSALAEGGATVTVTATDAAGKTSTRQTFARVDRVASQVSLSGTLTTAGEVLFGPSYDLQATVNDSALTGDRSGVRRIEVTVDGELKASRDGTCNAENACPQSLSLAYALNTDDLPDGYHTVTVRSEDAAHNIASRAIEVIVARRGPLAVPLGELRGVAGQAVTSAAPYALSVIGADQTSRVKAVGVSYGQGQELARDELTCVAVTCPTSRKATFQIDTNRLPEGEQTLRAFSMDGLLGRTESQPWTVTVDRTPPAPPGDASVDFDADEQVAVLSVPPGADPAQQRDGRVGRRGGPVSRPGARRHLE